MEYKIDAIEYEIAKKYPRDLDEFERKINKILEKTDVNEIYYKIPRKDKNNKITIVEGLSIKFAEIVIANFKNIKIFAENVKIDEKSVTSRCTIYDLENNTTITIDTVKSIVDKNGNRYGQELLNLVINSSISIAIRNAVYKIIPSLILNDIINNIKSKIKKEINSNFDKIKEETLKYFNNLDISNEKILNYLNLQSLDDIDKNVLEILVGLKNSIINGEVGLNIFEDKNEKNKKVDIEQVNNIITIFNNMGYPKEKVFKFINVKNINEITEEKVNELRKLYVFLKK